MAPGKITMDLGKITAELGKITAVPTKPDTTPTKIPATTAATQTVLFTVLPRGFCTNPGTLPVSVFVSPRLVGADNLGAFPDWVNWTAQLKERGLLLVFRSGTKHAEVRIDPSVLQPQLWSALFNRQTLVRSHTFDDYSSHGILSFSMRESLSALKAVYQQAGVVLALPSGANNQEGGRSGNRRILSNLVDGLDVHWNGDRAKQWRDVVRRRNSSGTPATQHRALNGPLDSEGLITTSPDAGSFQGVAVPFAVFNHMPTPDHETAGDVSIDPNAIDFHQALGSLESHPELLRALGLVFDVELPQDFLAQTAVNTFNTVAVEKTNFPWQLTTKSPALDTAYCYFAAGQNRFFLTASRTMTKQPSPSQVLGLVNLDPERFGLAQVDVDGGMHKAIMLAETWNNPDPDRNLDSGVTPEQAPHPEVYDPEATLPSLRSGGLQLYVDGRGLHVLDAIQQSKAFNDALQAGGAQPRPFFAEDLLRGHRLDVWDSTTNAWHSLHQRSGDYQIGDNRIPFQTPKEEGFQQFAATQPAPGANPADKDLYIHEAIARWAGWSLSVTMPGKVLSRFGDPDKAIPPDGDDPDYSTDEAITPYKVRATYKVLPGTLPRLKFGRRYRMRARAVDLAGNSMQVDDPLATSLAAIMALPRDPGGFTYLRYEPVISPQVVIRDQQAVTLPGSAVDRIVVRTYNANPAQDGVAADLTANNRHILPPRTSVEMAERHGMFDDATGKLKSDAATYKLIADRDAAELPQASINVAGKVDNFPMVTDAGVTDLPYLPDPLSRGAALRNLPGADDLAVGKAAPGAGAAASIQYQILGDPNPRPGSATIIAFNANDDWQKTTGFRLVLAEPQSGATDLRPQWDPAARVLTVFLSKGQMAVTPLSSYMTPEDLKLMGVWQWLREFIDRATILQAQPEQLLPGYPVDQIAYILQRAVEGGHWMLTPPHLLTLVHAVQQPIGVPQFDALHVDHQDLKYDTNPLQTARIRGRKDPAELGAITAWRQPGSTDAFLMGTVKIHGASTAQVDLMAEWSDPVDDPSSPAPDQTQTMAHADTLPLPRLTEGYLQAQEKEYRTVGYYDPEHDQIAMVRSGDRGAPASTWDLVFSQAAPRHRFNDTKRHRVNYTAVSTTRFREYFPQDQQLDFTRSSAPVLVDIPASARPLAPEVVYVVPTFGWQRQTDTNMKRSVRFGGGLRVYLKRGWYSSGEGELLGVALWSTANGQLNNAQRDKFKPFITQWGMDPIWQTADLSSVPGTYNFPDAVESDTSVSLEESSAAKSATEPGRVDVVGFTPQYDPARQLWFADLTVNLGPTYSPFLRLALVRYQPHALDDARISRVVLAGFAQLTPDRVATVTADPYHPRTMRVTVSGVAPRGPQPDGPGEPRPARPTHVEVHVQQRSVPGSDLSWQDVPVTVATITQGYEGPGLNQPDLALWFGTINFASIPQPGQLRILVEEFEFISASYATADRKAPGRLIYAETFAVDAALITE
ncbi:hypothetical protein [Edaphobacter albus]|uniref:hypothetical protein n=1 Tax=Edaphobacter sp. 4G125 TaxID=2763071 RepID=UPI001644E500|nr:hypothetical protein [Edaphobacter sp. 4G125]QNI37037.1 hypothetical protein H7846_01470 [Edaphobacter sp. 4G125]